jgi:hypothetical protein
MIPIIWCVWLKTMFDVHERMAARLWKAYPVTPTLLFQLAQCDERQVGRARLAGRVEHLSHLITPQSLLVCSLSLAPETGRARPPEHVAFEEQVLQACDRNGYWVW